MLRFALSVTSNSTRTHLPKPLRVRQIITLRSHCPTTVIRTVTVIVGALRRDMQPMDPDPLLIIVIQPQDIHDVIQQVIKRRTSMAIFDETMQGMTEEERRKRLLMQQGQSGQNPQLNGQGAVLNNIDMNDPLTAFAYQDLLKRMGG